MSKAAEMGPAPQVKRALHLLAACASASALIAAGAPDAHAGRWILLSCRQPDGRPAPTDGWSATATGALGPYSGASDSCASGGALTVNASGQAPQNAYAGPQWRFTAPAGSTIEGGLLSATLSSPHGQAWVGEPSDSYDGADVLANCQYNLPCGSAGTLSGSFPIAHPGATHIYATAVCVGGYEGASVCPAYGASDASLAISEAEIELSSASSPTASGFGGGMLSGEARGSQSLSFTASDPDGPGVQHVTVQADGAPLYTGTPDTDDGDCTSVATINGLPAYTSSQPCRQLESVALALQTTGLADGKHTLTVTVSDAAGNLSTVYDAQFATHNAPVNTSPPTLDAASPQIGEALGAERGTWSQPEGSGQLSDTMQWQRCDPSGEACHDIAGATSVTYTPTASEIADTLRVIVSARDNDGLVNAASQASAPVTAPPAGRLTAGVLALGAANGTGASEQASLTIDAPTRIVRTPAHSPLSVRGVLRSGQGAPIAGASIDAIEQNAGAEPRVLMHTRTAADGSFQATIPSGPSRVVSFAYRAFAGDLGYAASGSLTETVSAAVTLRVGPRHTSSTGTIVLSGQVAGPVPREGVIVELLVRYHGAWEPFRTPRTGDDGRFSVRYRFQGATGRFPFRAQVPKGQAGYPYAEGHSPTVNVSSG